MADCAQELCPNWSGDGRVCPCALLDIEPPRVDPYGQSYTSYVQRGDDRLGEDDPRDGMSSACFYDYCDWCQSPTCGCPCHTQIEEDWGDEHA